MAKARAIVKRRKAVKNTRKITKTMQMIATAKFQKSLKRAVGTKPFTLHVRQAMVDLVAAVGEVKHPLVASPDREKVGKIAVLVLSGNRGLAGAYNGNVARAAERFLKTRQAAGDEIELLTAGKKANSYFTFLKRKVTARFDQTMESASFEQVRELSDRLIKQYTDGGVDAIYVVYMNFVSTGVQKPEVVQLLPLASAREAGDLLSRQASEHATAHEKASQHGAAAADLAQHEANLHARGQSRGVEVDAGVISNVVYEFSPSAKDLLDEVLPIAVRTMLFQCFLDAITSENVARMVSMKAATDNADKMIKALTMQYNRARQSQITTELSEIMGGVEAMKK